MSSVFLVATSKKDRWSQFYNVCYSAQYVQNIISTCNQYDSEMHPSSYLHEVVEIQHVFYICSRPQFGLAMFQAPLASGSSFGQRSFERYILALICWWCHQICCRVRKSSWSLRCLGSKLHWRSLYSVRSPLPGVLFWSHLDPHNIPTSLPRLPLSASAW